MWHTYIYFGEHTIGIQLTKLVFNTGRCDSMHFIKRLFALDTLLNFQFIQCGFSNFIEKKRNKAEK